MDLYEILRYVGLVSLCIGGFSGMIAGLFAYYHSYFWINKFDRKYGFNFNDGWSFRPRAIRSSYLFALSLSKPDGWYQRYIRKIVAKDVYGGAEYLNKVPQEVLNSLRFRSRFFIINFITCITGCLIYYFLEDFV